MPPRRDPNRPELDEHALAEVLRQQDGLVLRAQLATLGASKSDVDRLVRQRRLARCREGVYVNHTGALTPQQRHWAAVLACGRRGITGSHEARGAALADESALLATSRRRLARLEAGTPTQVAVAVNRSLDAPPGVRIHYVGHLDRTVLWNASPPRMRPEYASLRVASRAADDMAAIGVLADAVGSRLTTPDHQRKALGWLPSLRRRALLARVVEDLANGSWSVLEHAYLVKVERQHGLPHASRQVVRAGADRREYRDVEYDELGLVVELDGKTFHEGSAARDRDLERDLDDHVDGKEAVRLGWGQVVGRPCATAVKVAVIMRRLGWTGLPRRCGPTCAVSG